jgi:predicted Zn-dependent protease
MEKKGSTMKDLRVRVVGLVALGLVVLLGGAGCSTVPVTGRKQLTLLSAGEEMQLGLTSFEQLKKETPISKDPALNALVQRVGKRIAQVAGPDMPNAQWEFVVFDSKEANAFCLPGGKVGVYTGILPITKDEAGLATVIGHEVAHAVARHGGERISEAMLIQTGGQLLSSSLSKSDPAWQSVAQLAYGAGTKLGRELPHSRSQESEADHIGLIYMARAGYDPQQAVAFWQRFMEYNKAQGGDQSSFFASFLRTHPLDEVRIRQLQQWMPEAQAAFVPYKGQ